MSFLSGHTKKVSVYGRRTEVRVVNRHSAFTSLENDENDPFTFFQTQSKPKATYGRSRASVLPSQLLSNSVDSDEDINDDTLDSQATTDQSAAYDTANSSLSFHSASSLTSSPEVSKTSAAKSTLQGGQRKALASKALNTKVQEEVEKQTTSKPRRSVLEAVKDDAASMTTPKAKRVSTKRLAADSPQTATKPPRAKATPSASRISVVIPIESTPPSTQQAGRAPRRAAQQARMAIEDYDFIDRDMTPRRPVPTKSYFVEKARQPAELAAEEEQERQQARPSSITSNARASKASAPKARKSMAPRPRHTTFLSTSRADAIAIPDSSLSSAHGVSDSSFEGGSTSQSSFSLIIPSYNDSSYDQPPKRSASAKAKVQQNKRVIRHIAADSDDEDDDKGDLGSDEESEQDPALKLAAQVADLAVTDEASADDGHLTELLASVSQTKPSSFSETIQQLRTAAGSTKTSRRRLEKIGEASYSEVFKISLSGEHEALVLKIIPISSPTSSASADEADDLPYTSPASDVEREIRLMQLIKCSANLDGSFVSLHSAHIVRGSYPAPLLQAWDRWDAKRRAKTGEGAENIRPHVLGRSQVYALLVMTDGGMDLESLKVKSWLQAASIFWQVVKGLGEMEGKYEFEHRDLHWGNILVRAVTPDSSPDETPRRTSGARSRNTGNALSWLLIPIISGVKATIIDFTLSRATPTSRLKPLYYPFDDSTLFDGSGDPQFEVYREMRTLTKDDWASFCSGTNVLWLRYLVHKLVDVKCKSVKAPKASEGLEFDAYTSLQGAAERLDEAVQQLLDGVSGKNKKNAGAGAGRRSLHPRARKSVASTIAAGARRGRATMAVTPLLHEQSEDDLAAVASAAGLLKLINC